MARILVVDDSLSVRKQLSDVLTSKGHTILEAVDGNDGYEKITSENLDLVITDYNMPGADGLTMLRKVIDAKGSLTSPVLVLTTETSQHLKSVGKEIGVRGWIIKPFNPEKLAAAIATLVGK